MANRRRLYLLSILGAALGLGLAGDALAWGEAGHRVIGHLAERHLRGTPALGRVRAILPPGESLADAAAWADEVKSEEFLNGEGAASREGRAFVRRNPKHRDYHFVNLPFQARRYRLGETGTRPDAPPHRADSPAGDIVQVMRSCIQVLRSPREAPADRFTKREALRLLAHLAGDLHMPLYVGSGYLRQTESGGWSFTIPDGPDAANDRGGNALRFTLRTPRPENGTTEEARTNLHAFWDDLAVERAMRGRPAPAYADALLREVPAGPHWRGRGNPLAWPERWAADTLAVARYAYDDVTITGRAEVSGSRPPAWDIALSDPDAYLNESAALARIQLAKAGYRLAELLKAIFR